MTKTNSEERLQAHIEALPKEITPGRDLWPGIELAIEHIAQQRPAIYSWAGIAASIVVVSLAGWLLYTPPLSDRPQAVDLSQLVADMSASHESQKRTLLAGYQTVPALTNNWQEQLAELDAAAAAVKTALQQEPDNAELLRMLQHIYRRQVELIESVHTPQWY